jgi:ABC-type multidrug transport system ATPase subunit
MFLSPQPPKLVNELTVEENLRLMIGRVPLGEERLRASAMRLLKWLGFPVAFLRERAEVLSGGEAGMVALVGASLSGAKILLLDEPFESLSPQALSRALKLLRLVTGAGKSALVTTHNANLISLFGPSQVIDLTQKGVLSGAWVGGQMSGLDSNLEGVSK